MGIVHRPPQFIRPERPVVYLDGPTSYDVVSWRDEAIAILQRLLPNVDIADPVVPLDGRYDDPGQRAAFVAWRTSMIARARVRGGILFHLPAPKDAVRDEIAFIAALSLGEHLVYAMHGTWFAFSADLRFPCAALAMRQVETSTPWVVPQASLEGACARMAEMIATVP